MYWRHFHLTAEPFSLTPDPSFLYLSPVHAEAYAAMTMGLRERRGLITMIGEVGTGKTTLVYSLLSGLGPEIHTAYVSNARLSFDGILRVALRDFGVPCDSTNSSDLLDAFNKFLHECAQEGTTAAMVIDEAQNLSNETFEDLRLLSNFETYTHKLLQIVLVGQPELDAKLRDPALRQVAERVAVRCVVNPLNRAQARAYLEHRLAAVNGSLDILTQPALRLLVAKSRGIPRSLNILAHNAMLFAYGEGRDKVTRRLVAAAVREKEGRSLVRLWRRPKRERKRAAGTGIRSPWLPTIAALAGLLVGLAVAGGERVIGNLRDTPRRSVTSTTGPVRSDDGTITARHSAAPEATSERGPSLPETRGTALPTTPVVGDTPGEGTVQPAPAEPAPAPTPEPIAAVVESTPTPEPAPAEPAPAPTPEQPALAEPAPAPTPEPAPAEPAPVPRPEPIAAVVESAPTPEQPALAEPAPQAQAAVTAPAPVAAPSPPTATVEQRATRPAPRPRTAAAPRPAVQQATANPPPRAETTTNETPANNTTEAERVRVVTVPAGSSLSDLMLAVYGQYSSNMMQRVQAVNPQVTDPDRIIAGDRLRFPGTVTPPNTPATGAEP